MEEIWQFVHRRAQCLQINPQIVHSDPKIPVLRSAVEKQPFHGNMFKRSAVMSLRTLILFTLFLGLGAHPRMGRGFGNPSRFSHRRTFGFYKPWGPWKPRSDPSQPRQAWGSRDNLPVGQRPRSLGAKLGSRGLRRKTFGLGVSPGLTIMTPQGMFITGFLSRQFGVEASFSLYHRFRHLAINSHFLTI